jgi:RNA recognition motif-containing protein
VHDCVIILDKDTGQSRGFGFVQIDSEAEALLAIEKLNGYWLNGRDLRVNEAIVDRRRSPAAAGPPRWR